MTVGQMIITFFSAIALGYTIGMTHWIVMDAKRQDKAFAQWQARHDADLIHQLLEETKP